MEKNQSPVQTQNDEEYDELLERLRLADFLYTEYSLEEVIYQLAKVMFTQSLTRGNAEAQKALQKFTGFLESEAEQGHISRALEKKVLGLFPPIFKFESFNYFCSRCSHSVFNRHNNRKS